MGKGSTQTPKPKSYQVKYMTLNCKFCNQENEKAYKFCKACGEELHLSPKNKVLEPGNILDERYEIKRRIKEGGMGTVYEASDLRFGKRSCAVKEMLCEGYKPEDQPYIIESFKKEAHILHHLRHTSLPVVQDYFVEEGRYYLVMDYIEGKDLGTIRDGYEGKGVPEEDVIDWTLQVLDALEYLHCQNPPIVYRDLKPDNIMLRNNDNKAVLVDFGLARPVPPGSTKRTTIVGTPAYAPEELFQGRAEPRTDIYSLGGTMHSLLTGIVPQNPFSFEPVRNIKPSIAEELENIINKALGRLPDNRYESASKMREALFKLKKTEKEDSLPGLSGAKTIGPFHYESKITEPSEQSLPDNSAVTSVDMSREKTFSPAGEAQESLIKKDSDFHTKPVLPLKKEKRKGLWENILIGVVAGIFLLLITGMILLAVIGYIWNYLNNQALEEARKLNETGLELYNQGRYEESLASFDEALSKDISNKEIWFNKGNTLHELGRYEEALNCYNQITAGDLNYSATLERKALIFEKSGDYNSAFDCYSLLGKDQYFWYDKGAQFNDLSKYNEAILCYEKALELDPDYLDALYSIGLSLTNSNEYEKAIEYYDRALFLSPSDVEILQMKGRALSDLNKYGEAIEYFDRALEIDSTNAAVLADKGYTLLMMGNYMEAIKYFSAALSIDSEDKYTWNNKGVAYYNLGKYDKAIECYKKALSIDPDFEIARENIQNIQKE